jgi:tetratricopeptide (TPR) repeat protein
MPKYKDNWNLNYSLGKCYAGLEQFDLAIDYINHAIELNKDNPDLYNELGIIYFNNGDINRAIELFTKGIEIYADLKLFFNRAMSYGQIKEYRKALDDINEAYRLNPNEDIKNHKDYFETIVKNMS